MLGNYSPKPSEYLLAPGDPPPIPYKGTVDEFARVYVETVGLYKQCEDQKAALRDFFEKN